MAAEQHEGLQYLITSQQSYNGQMFDNLRAAADADSLAPQSLISTQEQDSTNNTSTLEFSKEIFLESVRQFRCLWDQNNPLYKDRNAKANACNHLSQMFRLDGQFSYFHNLNLIEGFRGLFLKHTA